MTAASIEYFQNYPASPLGQRLGLTLENITAQRASATMPVAGNTQPFGLLHGGATGVLVEEVASLAALAHAIDVYGLHPDGTPAASASGIELNVSHVRAATAGHVRAIAQPIHLGRTLAVYLIDVYDADDPERRIASGKLTCILRSLPPPRP